MSDMKLYKILETFDKLESANDKLEPYVAEESDAEGAAERIHARVAARDADESEVQETQTKVQTMGNKVRVTTDGDTTEFDDTETAAAMMGSKDDENQFATEAVSDDDGDWAYDNKKDKDLDDKHDEELAKKEKEELDEWAPEVSQDQDWDDDDDDDDDDEVVDEGNAVEEEAVTEEVVDEAAEDDAEEVTEEAFGHIDDFDRDQGIAQGTEFSTFDSENEAHRKRLQRGTPVVLSPEICSDAAGNRRGVFVNRSTSGHFGTVIRDCDGQTVKVHLSDIVSADITNNSVYEQYNIDFDAMLAEDITMTQTTNMDNSENDTTTVTAVGPDAGEELAAIMANAGMNTGEYASVDAAPDEVGPVDTGEPGMQDMIGIIDAPSEPVQTELPAAEPVELNANASCGMRETEGWDDEGWDDTSLSATGPTDADLDHIEAEPDREKELHEDHLQYLSPDIGLAIANGHDIYDAMTNPEVPEKDRNLLRAEYEEIYKELSNSEFATQPGQHPDDDFEAYEATAFEQMAQKIYDIYSTNSDDNAGGMFGKNPLDDFPDLEFTEEGADDRDIQHANTPNELEAGVDMVTHGTSGGLNRAKNMFRKEYPGDNPMAVTEDDDEDADRDIFGLDDDDDDYNDTDVDESKKEVDESEDPFFVNEHESVDNFLGLYKEFAKRGEKK